MHDPRAVVHADRRRRASPPMVERIAQCGESGRVKTRQERGFANVTYSILHSQDGTVAYVNRFQEPAFFGRNEADGAIRQYSARMGGVPKLGPGSFRPPVDYVALYPRPDEPLLSLKVL